MKNISAFILLFLVSFINPCISETVASRVIENGGTGAHRAIMITDASLPTHTLFRPNNIANFGEQQRLPVVVWGNGACYDSPWEHVNFLNEIASNGFLVIAIGTMPKESGEQEGRLLDTHCNVKENMKSLADLRRVI